jgi:hypothetical protein
MNDRRELRRKLIVALLEWRDAGGPVEDVVEAIEALAWDVAARLDESDNS